MPPPGLSEQSPLAPLEEARGGSQHHRASEQQGPPFLVVPDNDFVKTEPVHLQFLHPSIYKHLLCARYFLHPQNAVSSQQQASVYRQLRNEMQGLGVGDLCAPTHLIKGTW